MNNRTIRWRGLRSPITAAALALLLTSSVAACSRAGGGASGSGSSTKRGGLTIGVSMYSRVEARWQYDAAAFEKQAKADGDKVIMTFANADPQKQTQDVQGLITQGVDVLVIAATDVSVGGGLIAQAKRAGIKTIAYDIGVQHGLPDWHIQRNQSDVATMQIAAAKKFAPSGNYAVLKGDAGNDLAQKSDPVYATLASDSKIHVVYNDWTPGYSADKAKQIADSVLTQHNDKIAAFLANADVLAEPVAQAVKERGLSGKVFVAGLDAEPAALKLIAEGAMTMTIWTPIDQMGRLAAIAADDLGHGRKPASNATTTNDVSKSIPTEHVDMMTVDKSNLCHFILHVAPKGWTTPQEVFGRADACQ
jgi:D-xylose transport system substrate-binding protein